MFDGRLIAGKPTNSGSLTFDRWHQDQTVQMRSVEDGPNRTAGFIVNDRPDRPMQFDRAQSFLAMSPGPERDAAAQAAGFNATQRIYLGSKADRSAALALRDGAGRPRLVMRVESGGRSSIEFLDEAGRVVRASSSAR